MMFQSNNLHDLRMYKNMLDACVSSLENAIKHGKHRHYYDSTLTYAISEDRETTEVLLLGEDDLRAILVNRMSDRDEITEKIKWLEDLAEKTADKMEHDAE